MSDDIRQRAIDVATDALVEHWSSPGSATHTVRVQALAVVDALKAAGLLGCPHVITSDEGTSYCGLAQRTGLWKDFEDD